MSLHQIDGLYFAPSDVAGRGVFCAQRIQKDDIIEICPVIVLPSGEKEWIDQSVLYDYYFAWGEDQEEFAIALGLGSLYNHSSTPGSEFIPEFASQSMIIKALQDIPEGVEITVDYHAGISRPLWFKVKSA